MTPEQRITDAQVTLAMAATKIEGFQNMLDVQMKMHMRNAKQHIMKEQIGMATMAVTQWVKTKQKSVKMQRRLDMLFALNTHIQEKQVDWEMTKSLASVMKATEVLDQTNFIKHIDDMMQKFSVSEKNMDMVDGKLNAGLDKEASEEQKAMIQEVLQQLRDEVHHATMDSMPTARRMVTQQPLPSLTASSSSSSNTNMIGEDELERRLAAVMAGVALPVSPTPAASPSASSSSSSKDANNNSSNNGTNK